MLFLPTKALFNAFEKAKLLVKPPYESYSSMIRMGVLGSLEKSSFQEVHMDYSPPTNEIQNQVIDGESGRFGRGIYINLIISNKNTHVTKKT